VIDGVAVHPQELVVDVARFVDLDFEEFGGAVADLGGEGPGQDVGGVFGFVIGVGDGEPDGRFDVVDLAAWVERGGAYEAGLEDGVIVFDEVGTGLVEGYIEVAVVTNAVEVRLFDGGAAKEAGRFAYEEVGEDVADDLEPIEFELALAVCFFEEG
jgi:hypothetical protein